MMLNMDEDGNIRLSNHRVPYQWRCNHTRTEKLFADDDLANSSHMGKNGNTTVSVIVDTKAELGHKQHALSALSRETERMGGCDGLFG